MAQMDPSHSVPQELMSHVHLVSAFRYPTVARLDVNEVVRWLMNAPQVARDRAPFFWTYLDKPTDGTVLLTWQPLQRLNSNFATDGFIWAPPEQVYKQELGNGLILEIYYLKAGYMPGEQFALHARRRFRLMPMPGHPNPPQIDISLFIVHYGPSDHNDRIPAAMVPYDERVNAIMQQRHYLLRGGQIRRKEFMLSDRVNWPMLPELTRQQMAPQMGPQMMGRGVPQQMAYPPQPVAPPPAKRARHSAGQGAPPVVGPALQPTEGLDDDEDITRGDMFDQVTQREVSLGRFKQSYEWMEEILSSAYRMNQIMPSDLNLGLKGELSALTEGIFTAQGVEVFTQAPDKPYVGKLDEGLADEFRKRVDEYIKTTQAEMDDIKAQHATTMASLRTGSVFTVKEAELRALSVEPAAAEPAKGEESSEPAGGEQESEGQARHRPMFKKAVDDVSRDVEAAIGRKIVRHPNVRRIQQGGYQAPEPQLAAHMSRQASHNSGVMMGDADVDMGGTAAGLLDQMHSGMSPPARPRTP
ncbi:hypothetical protein CDD82_6800 [Ophiocordyceps australis]|uniref:DUF1750-domain-containing protein n=1 Tax=Ophiocordyceps australis TaxID=1399860 RepID=A0A2C5YNA7_9HYPO|nr:hypothetical protein CDD82_6800 [Ophiocordyceps australis]